MPDTILEMKNISKQFDGNYVLKDASFSLGYGEVHALVGENGAGKSTLMNILAGVFPPDSGEMFLDGNKIGMENAKKAQKLGIGAIFQNYDLFYNMDIGENIFINQEPVINFGPIRFVNWRMVYKRTKEILEYLNINIDPRTPVKALGAGNQKFIEIARTIVDKCRIIIMDEPTAALTEQETEFLFEIIKHLKSTGVSVIYISHRLDEISHIADRITVLRDGLTVAIIDKEEYDSILLMKMIIGDKIKDRYPKLNVKIGKDILIVKNLCNEKFLKNISFSLRKGEILGITGLKGSGKTTLAKVLFGVEAKTSGSMYINGRKVEIKNTENAVNNGLCYVPSNRIDEGLIYKTSVANNIVVTNLKSIVSKILLSLKLKRKESEKYVKMIGINLNSLSEKIKNLSGGNQKKVILAKWLFRNSKIIILNEPTSSIDIAAKVDIYNILNELVMSGTSIIMISSEIPELLGMCDRILVMYHGGIVKELYRGEATQEKILYYASGGQL